MGRTTLAVTLKPESGRDGQHVVRIRITRNREPRFWALSLAIDEKHFNPEGKPDRCNWVRKSHVEARAYNERILAAYRRAEAVIADYDEKGQPYTALQVRDTLTTGGPPERLLPFLVAHITKRRTDAGDDLSKLTTAETYADLLTVLRGYLRESLSVPDRVPDTGLDELSWAFSTLTKKHILDLRVWLQQHYADSSVSSFLSKLRHVLYQAADAGLVSYEHFPMRGVRINVTRKQVQRLRVEEIDRLATAPIQKKHRGGHPAVTNPAHARPLALAMFLCHGARVQDAITWRMSNYVVEGKEHRLRYQTGKNKKWLSVLLDEEGIELFAPYRLRADGTSKAADDYLFPYLPVNYDKLPAEERFKELRKCKNRAKAQITRLGEQLGFGNRITAHLMRHSFADMMRREGVPIEVRQSVLGHSDIRTTRDYDDQFDQAESDSVTTLLYQRRKRSDQDNSSATNVKADSET